MPRRPRLNYLRAFDASARYLSFSLAAEELNLSQAAISQQIKQLEAALGAPLFLRHNRSLTLSENGKAYFQVVREVLDRLDNVTDKLFPYNDTTVVTVHCTPSVGTLWLAPRLSRFHLLHPEIEVHLRTTDFLPEQHRGQASDLEILRLEIDTSVDKNTIKLWDAEIVPVCSPHYLAEHGPIESADHLCGQSLIHTLGYGNDWHRWAQRYASSNAKVNSGFSVDGLVIAIEAACRGEGIILGRKPLIDPYLQDGRLVEPMTENLMLTAPYYLKYDARGPSKKFVVMLAEWISEQANEGPSG